MAVIGYVDVVKILMVDRRNTISKWRTSEALLAIHISLERLERHSAINEGHHNSTRLTEYLGKSFDLYHQWAAPMTHIHYCPENKSC